MNIVENIKECFERSEANSSVNGLSSLRKEAFDAFHKMGIPTAKHEEWKYTRIGNLFNKEYGFSEKQIAGEISKDDLKKSHLPGYKQANEIFFINGIYSSSLSTILSAELVVMSLEETANSEYKKIVEQYFGDSSKYLKDGINALNTAFANNGIFIHVKRGSITEHPVYVYHIADASAENIFSQPRSLVHIAENAQVQIVETYFTIGKNESFINEVMEVVVEKDARLEYYKIQNNASHANEVSTTHIRQSGKSYVHTVVISLNGAIIRNNLNVVLDAEKCESHLYGLYFPHGKTHIDNHTVVDNVKPNSFSNELYKGILTDNATGVFNGKIFVQPGAQKTNAYQSNKNILLSDGASVNTKPQLEIFADDVKCSHGCTVGRLNEEGLFYLQSRGISEKTAKSLLVHSFAIDILEHINLKPIREYVNKIISERLEVDLS